MDLYIEGELSPLWTAGNSLLLPTSSLMRSAWKRPGSGAPWLTEPSEESPRPATARLRTRLISNLRNIFHLPSPWPRIQVSGSQQQPMCVNIFVCKSRPPSRIFCFENSSDFFLNPKAWVFVIAVTNSNVLQSIHHFTLLTAKSCLLGKAWFEQFVLKLKFW